MSPVPKLALHIPQFWGHRIARTEELVSFFQRAEELGFDSLWVIDRPLHWMHVPEILTLLTYAAACTERIGLGTSVLLLNLRHPLDLARQAATLDALSGGRLTLGVAMGGRGPEYEAMSVPIHQRVGRLEEGMAVLRRLWTETDVTFHGRYYNLENANVSPKPSRPGGIPLPIGASTEPGMRRAGRISDGWIAGGHITPEQFAHQWQVVQDAAREAGRDPSKLINLHSLYVNVDSDRERARRELQECLEAYYGGTGFRGDMGDHSVVGTPQDVARAVRAFGDAGAQTVALSLPWPDVAKLEWLAAEVMPALE